MLKNTILLSAIMLSGVVSAQWTPAKSNEKRSEDLTKVQKKELYKLDINEIRAQLKDAQLQGPNARPVYISVPVMGGKVELFKVYSFPVMVPELAEQYQLGSYTGVSTENPTKFIRFSVAPNDFQSMVYDEHGYQFISPEDKSKGLYSVHPKTNKASGKDAFVCDTEHGHSSSDIDRLRSNNSFANVLGDFSRNSDRKYRTLRLVVSTTGEYTTHFGGVAGALAQINATITRVNAVFEKDFALHLVLQNYPNIVYPNAASDPYTGQANWNVQLQQTLTANVGNANYDIGHLFGRVGNNGNAGCIGCICVDPSTQMPRAKGSGFTTSTNPQGDAFDIDFVAHEIGHQLGANHTFSHGIEGTGVNMEPGSGSTIMGYAGITGPTTDVQTNSDPYFHAASIQQVQTNLISKTCDVETDIVNNPPVIDAFPAYTIPKSTAFVLTGNATDPEGDAMTYTWEQYNTATSQITNANLGNTTHGGSFRSKLPSTSTVRYFPALSTVLNGSVRDVASWESASTVARNQTFRFTARDNNANVAQQQTNARNQVVTVGDDGPFRVITDYTDAGNPTNFEWDVVNTNNAPYNVTNVSIDYTTDNGNTWTTLVASTANDGNEMITFPASLNGQTVKVRVSAIDNIFYAVGAVNVTQLVSCDGTAPSGLTATNPTSFGVTLNWVPVSGASYEIRYRVVGTATWTTVTSTTHSITLNGLSENTNYEVQVAAVCNGVVGAFSNSVNFTTAQLSYCSATSQQSNYEYISNVTVANLNNDSGAGTYTNYSNNSALQVNLAQGQQYTISVAKNWVNNSPDYDAVSAWIDFNRNGQFESSERILTSPVAQATTVPTIVSAQFTVPTTAVTGVPLRMRVINLYAGQTNDGLVLTNPCLTFQFGEVEDYQVVVTPQMSTVEIATKDSVRIYPNPVAEILNVTKVSNKAEYQVVNAAGQLVLKGVISDNKVDVGALEKGNYIISVKDGATSFSEKFIKK